MNEKIEFSLRLRQAMLDLGYEARASVLENQFNTRYWGKSLTHQAVRRWLRGEAIPSQDKLKVLAEWLKVEPEVLRFGEAAGKKITKFKNDWVQAVNHTERETFEAFIKLPPEQRKIVRETVQLFTKANTAGSAATN